MCATHLTTCLCSLPERCLAGIAREVYRLTGGVPSLAPLTETFKERPKWGSKQVSKWELRPIQSPLQSPSFALFHWERAADPAADSPYARPNTEAMVPQYTDEEYAQHFSTDETWTRQDTDHLFDLCRQFDLRFALVADRWQGQSPRSIEVRAAEHFEVLYSL